MINLEDIISLSNRDSVIKLEALKKRVKMLIPSNSEAAELAHEMFRTGSKSHLNSLNPLVRDELGFQLYYMTQELPDLKKEYLSKKGRYLSIGKSYGTICFLFDLIGEEFCELDLLLMHELLMDDGQYRNASIFIQLPDKPKKIFLAGKIAEKIGELFCWYDSLKGEERVSQVVLAAIFHFYLLSIHPFFDGNGRVSRLFMNLIILKDGLFPIAIPNDTRVKYYQALEQGDGGGFEEIVDYISVLAHAKLEDYERLTIELSKIRLDTQCLVLTEDGNTAMIESILSFHGFDMETTSIESYDGKDNIAAAAFLARKTIGKQPTIKHVIFHIDRDNENTQNLKQRISSLTRSNGLGECSTIFVTKNYDMESYFIDERHINSLYPEISTKSALGLIGQATEDTEEVSKRKLRIAFQDYGRFKTIEDPSEKTAQINTEYESNPQKYRYGKDVLYRLEELVGIELKNEGRVSLVKGSQFITIADLESAKNILYGNV